MTYNKFFIAAFVCLLLTTAIFSQNGDLSARRELWQTRSETITNNLLKETSKITELERALLFAQLGDLWHQSDLTQSDVWFNKSVDAIFFYSPEDSKADKKNLFQTARQVLNIISNRNQKQSIRLLKILTGIDKENKTESDVNADALIEYALQIVKENPARAAQIGIIALKTGHPKSYYKLIWKLNENNKILADQFFKEAFSIAVTSPDYYHIQSLQIAAFPENVLSDFPSNLLLPAESRITTLNFLADYIIQLQADFINKKISKCSSEAFLISGSKKQFADLLPQKVELVQQAIGICMAEQPAQRRRLPDTVKNGTVDELLKLADENKDDALVRTVCLYRAALLSYNQKKYETTIKILESMDEKERQTDSEFWEQARAESAGLLAYAQCQKDDFQNCLRTLQDTPSSIRAFAQVIFVKQYPGDNESNYSFRVETLDDARKNFIKSEKPFMEKSGYWFLLVKSYADHKLLTEASEVFKEITKSFNSSVPEDSGNQPEISSQAVVTAFSPALLEAQEIIVFDAVNSIDDSKSRININLAFLKISLQKYEAINSEIKKLKQNKPGDKIQKDN